MEEFQVGIGGTEKVNKKAREKGVEEERYGNARQSRISSRRRQSVGSGTEHVSQHDGKEELEATLFRWKLKVFQFTSSLIVSRLST
jgi:hypothetical protein